MKPSGEVERVAVLGEAGVFVEGIIASVVMSADAVCSFTERLKTIAESTLVGTAAAVGLIA